MKTIKSYVQLICALIGLAAFALPSIGVILCFFSFKYGTILFFTGLAILVIGDFAGRKLGFFAAIALIASIFAFSAKAQTNLNQVPDLLGTNGPISLTGSLGQVWTAFTQSQIMQATNYALAPYLTYAPKAPEKVGGGLLAIYNVSDYVGAALGVDYLGSFSLVSGNVTLKADTQPLKTITWLSWAPDTVRNVTVTPFTLLGVGQPLGGTSGQGAATIWDVGGEIKFGHLWGGRFGAGATWGEWQNAGAYSGHRYHAFLSWQKGF